MTKKDYLLGFCLFALVVENAWVITSRQIVIKPKQVQPKSSPFQCLLTGELLDKKNPTPLDASAFGNVIRLRFEASSFEDCKSTILEYCRQKQEEGYTPKNLLVTSKNANSAQVHRTGIQPDCNLGPSRD